jgi:hypothetical protein
LFREPWGTIGKGGADIKIVKGGYTYGQLSVGALFSRNHTLSGGRVIKANTPFLPGLSGTGAGFFHIHPLGQPEDRNFSEGDQKTYRSLYANSGARAPLSYLGGNDGSLDVFRPRSDGKGVENVNLGGAGYFGTRSQ